MQFLSVCVLVLIVTDEKPVKTTQKLNLSQHGSNVLLNKQTKETQINVKN